MVWGPGLALETGEIVLACLPCLLFYGGRSGLKIGAGSGKPTWQGNCRSWWMERLRRGERRGGGLWLTAAATACRRWLADTRERKTRGGKTRQTDRRTHREREREREGRREDCCGMAWGDAIPAVP